jgi:hypothetical protein
LGQHLQTSGWGDKWSRRHCHGRSPSFGCFVKQDEAIAFKLRTQSSKDTPTSNFWPYQSSDPSAITKTKLESTSFVFKAIFSKMVSTPHPLLIEISNVLDEPSNWIQWCTLMPLRVISQSTLASRSGPGPPNGDDAKSYVCSK